jgi:hypothetical protein
VTVESDNPYIPFGYNYTTPELFAVDLDSAHASATGVSYLDADFGFGPALLLDKSLLSDVTVYEGDLVTHNVRLVNTRPGSEQGPSQYTLWAADLPTDGSPPVSTSGNQAWFNRQEGIGIPDSRYAVCGLKDNTQQYGTTGYNIGIRPGTVLTVAYRLYLKEIEELKTGTGQADTLEVSLWLTNEKQAPLTFDYSAADFSEPAGETCVFSQILTRSWAWSDFRDNQVELGFLGEKGSGNAPEVVGLDAAALIITSDEPCGGPNDSIAVLPMTDTYDADKLSFISTAPPEDSVYTTDTPYTTTGVISWTNLSPLNAGQVKQLTLLFEALELPNRDSTTVTNTLAVTGALYANGGQCTRPATWSPTRSWAPAPSPTWCGMTTASVWEVPLRMESRQSGSPASVFVVVELWQDDGDSNFERGSGSNDDDLVLSTTTTITGFYLFDGFQNGDYLVCVDPATLPTGFSKTGDPDAPDVPCAGNCDNTGGTLAPIPINNSATLTTNDDDLDQDFGYYGNSIIAGTIWHGRNQSGTESPDAGEEWLTSVVVTLTNGTLMPTTTAENGCFRFIGPYTGTYTVTVDAASGDMGSGA